MRHSTRFLLAATMSASLVAAALPQAASAVFDDTELKCRSTISKSGGKYAKTVLKALTGCHKERDKEGPNGLDCNDLATADLKDKVPSATTKLASSIAAKCTSGLPSDILYEDCPAPCADDVPTISDFATLSSCLACLTRENNQAFSEAANGDPNAPITVEDRADCHKAITKNGSKLFNSVVKTIAKCQANFEKNGSETVSPSCVSSPGFEALTNEAYTKAQETIFNVCENINLVPAFDACGGEATVFDLSVCVASEARYRAQELVIQFLELPDSGVTTTTTTTNEPTTTTTTTLPDPDPACPDLGELTLYSKASNEVCANDGDCTFPRTCNLSTLRCQTVADLDSGWTGSGHDSDINDGVTAMANLLCPGPASPGCGECLVTGLNPTPGNCRCANNVLIECDEPFVADADDCGGSVCNCWFGTPFPLSAQGTPVCVSNRFSQDITGTANPDLGSGVITANLRASVYTGYTTDMPCPVCGGKCSDDDSGCIFDSDCDGPATCVQDTPNDGIRDGLCVRDPDFHTGDGVACDITATNASFPGVLNTPTPGSGGGGYSIDCQPDIGKNVSGEGLKIALTQSTGVTSVAAGLDCDGAGAGTDLCHCKVCSGDQTAPCASDAECGLPLLGNCSLATSGGGFACAINSDCDDANLGPCNNLNRCAKKSSLPECANNAECVMDAGTCNPQTCTALGATSVTPKPNDCADDICSDDGDGEGICLAGPTPLFCDGLVTAEGKGINPCANNSDCLAGYGTCTIPDQLDCFLDPIVASGTADPDFPVAGAVFCVPPVSGVVSGIAGLPGPGRVVSQGAARTFCASDHGTEYTPGGSPACP